MKATEYQALRAEYDACPHGVPSHWPKLPATHSWPPNVLKPQRRQVPPRRNVAPAKVGARYTVVEQPTRAYAKRDGTLFAKSCDGFQQQFAELVSRANAYDALTARLAEAEGLLRRVSGIPSELGQDVRAFLAESEAP